MAEQKMIQQMKTQANEQVSKRTSEQIMRRKAVRIAPFVKLRFSLLCFPCYVFPVM